MLCNVSGCSGLVSGLMLALVLLAAPAWSQTEEEIAGARSAAVEGAQAFEAGDWSKAVDLFGRAESLVHAPPHLLYMARAHIKLGHLVTARELYNKIIRENLAEGAPEPFKQAQETAREEIKRVEPRLAKLTVTVQAPEGVVPQVTMDGKEVSPALLGVPRPVDPGEHVIAARAEGHLAVQNKSVLAEGGSDAVTLTLEPDPNYAPVAAAEPAAEPVAATPPPATPADAGVESGGGLAIPAYVALGVGVVGVGAGVLFTLQSAGKRSDADEAFDRCASQGADGECKQADPLSNEVASLDDEAGSARTMAIVGYALGGVGIAAGVTMLLLDGPGAASASEPRIVPWLGYRSVGVTGTF